MSASGNDFVDLSKDDDDSDIEDVTAERKASKEEQKKRARAFEARKVERLRLRSQKMEEDRKKEFNRKRDEDRKKEEEKKGSQYRKQREDDAKRREIAERKTKEFVKAKEFEKAKELLKAKDVVKRKDFNKASETPAMKDLKEAKRKERDEMTKQELEKRLTAMAKGQELKAKYQQEVKVEVKEKANPEKSALLTPGQAKRTWLMDGKDCFNRFTKLKATSYQTDVVNALLKNNVQVFSVLHSMGSGKTLSAILSAECYMQKEYRDTGKIKRTIFVTPASVTTTIKGELLKYGRTKEHIKQYYSFYTPGLASRRFEKFKNECTNNLVIIDEFHTMNANVQQLVKDRERNAKEKGSEKEEDEEEVEEVEEVEGEEEELSGSAEGAEEEEESSSSASSSSSAKPRSSSSSSSAKRQPQIAHVPWLNWPKGVGDGKTTAAVILGAQVASKVLIMTGTLMTNGKQDLQNLALLYERGPLRDSKFNRKDVELGLRDEDIRKLLKCKVSYLSSEDVKAELPLWSETAVLIEMPPEYYNEYAGYEAVVVKGKKSSTGPGAFLSAIRQQTIKIKELNPKIDWILQLIQKNPGKMIISTEWVKKGLKVLLAKLAEFNSKNPSKQVTVGHVFGKMSANARKKMVDDYNAGEIRIIVISKAGGTGLNFKNTNFLIKVDSGFHEAGKRQAMFRAIRNKSHQGLPESERKVQVFTLYLVKKNELDNVHEEFKKDIRNRVPGAPSDVELVRYKLKSGEKGAQVEANEDMAAIDVALYRMQKKKAKISEEIVNDILKESSIENKDNNCSKK